MKLRDINWRDVASVTTCARYMADTGRVDMVVLKYPGRANFNIGHASRYAADDPRIVQVVRPAIRMVVRQAD